MRFDALARRTGCTVRLRRAVIRARGGTRYNKIPGYTDRRAEMSSSIPEREFSVRNVTGDDRPTTTAR